jgi:acyl-lipid omega-6 desaturase (Delta-12 desaturase)
LTPYQRWRKHHAVHHATSGNLDRRGFGDVLLMTVREYQEASPIKRLFYRINRNPFIMFGIGAFGYFAIWQRFVYEPKTWHKERASVWWTNAFILIVGIILSALIGLDRLLLIHLPVVAVASTAGVWLFYVQHHFEETYWEHNDKWEYIAAGMDGCSYYQLPKLLTWITANIGMHHIHHLDSRIPNYHLKTCFDENPEFQRVHRLTLWQSLSCMSLRLWDEENGKMVGYPKRESVPKAAH